MVEFHAVAIDGGLAPVALMRNQGIAEGELSGQFEAGFGAHAWFVAAAEAVVTEVVRTHQGEDHRAVVRHQIARQTKVEQSNAAAPITIIDPALRRKLDSDGALNRAKGNFL